MKTKIVLILLIGVLFITGCGSSKENNNHENNDSNNNHGNSTDVINSNLTLDQSK